MKTTAKKRINSILARFFSVALAVGMLMCGVGCGEEEEDWLVGPENTPPSISTSSGDAATSPADPSAEGFEGEYNAPVFKTGKYELVNSTIKVTECTDDTGAAAYTYPENTRYTYTLDINVGETTTCTYTFKNIYIGNSTQENTSVLLDTDDPDTYKDTVTQAYFDLIGCSFTAHIDAAGNVTGITGIDEITRQFPDTAELLSTDSMLAMAGDLFYPLPSTFKYGTTWTLDQYGVSNTYTIERYSRDLFGVFIEGEQPETYSYTDSGNSAVVTVTCSQITPMVGQLWVSPSDRAIQELSTYQLSSGTMSYDEYDIVYNYTYTVMSTSTVTAVA